MNDETQRINVENNLTTIENAIRNKQIKTREELLNTLEALKNSHPGNKELVEQKEKELLILFDSLNPTKAESLSTSNAIDYSAILEEIKTKIENGYFASKDALTEYINELKVKGIPEDVLSSDKIREYLELYDKYHQNPLDLENYKDINIQNDDLFASKASQDVIVNISDLPMDKEFQRVQNDLTSRATDGLANADNAFVEMKDNQKKELDFIPISEFSNTLTDDKEILKKIKYFLANNRINPHEYGINVENGYFYNYVTNDIYEVRINEGTKEYEVYRGEEKIYAGELDNQIEQQDIELTEENELEKQKSDVKVKKLIKPPEKLDNAAYVKNIFLLVMGVVLATMSLSFFFYRLLGH